MNARLTTRQGVEGDNTYLAINRQNMFIKDYRERSDGKTSSFVCAIYKRDERGEQCLVLDHVFKRVDSDKAREKAVKENIHFEGYFAFICSAFVVVPAKQSAVPGPVVVGDIS